MSGLFYLCKKPITLKSISLFLNVALILAVGFLYFKVYSKEEPSIPPVSAQAAASRIVYVNSDSLMDQYNLFKEMQDRMEKKRDSLDKLLTAKGRSLDREVKEYQEGAAGMSAGERELREESLMRKQQALFDEREGLLESLKEEEAALTDSIYSDMMRYLRSFNSGKGYDFILGYSRGGGILLANDSLDITRQVVSGLNKSK